MIKNTYKDIPDGISSTLKSIISETDVYHKNHARRMARTLQILLENCSSGRLLEVGTSHLIPIALSELNKDFIVTVTDFDLTKDRQGRMQCSLSGKSAEVDVLRLNIENEPIPVLDNTFDIVLLCEVVEHMEVDPMFMISEINRVLKDNGTLIITTPNSTSTRSVHKILSGIEPYFYMQYRHDGSLYRHNYEYSLPTLKAVLKSAGFEGSFWTEDSFEEPIDSVYTVLQQIGANTLDRGDNIFCVVKKTQGVVDRYPKEIYVD